MASKNNIEFVAKMNEIVAGKTILHVAYSPEEDGFALIFTDKTSMIVSKPRSVAYGKVEKITGRINGNLN